MCNGITCEYLHLTSGARLVDIKCDDLAQDDLNPDVCESVVLGLII